jgi:hypothetical protein
VNAWPGTMSRDDASAGISGWRKLVQGIVLFVFQQYFSTWGIIILAASLTDYIFDLLHLFRKTLPSTTMYWILTGTPYYPIQIGLGLLLGWLIGRRVRHRAMVWVWVLPFAYLSLALIASPQWIPPGESRWKHYFGWGYGGMHPCFDQAVITLPFYAAAAYSVGALLARKMPKHPHLASRRELWTFAVAGFIFVLFFVLELELAIQQGWKSMYLDIVVMPLGIGAFLILYAVMLRSRLTGH